MSHNGSKINKNIADSLRGAGRKAATIILLLLTLVYVAGVDSLSNYNVIAYGALLAGLWWLVKLLHKEQNKSKEEGR